jgi:hydroxymethylpyrimidine pyrophosphatase-like HAD family hydrolase
MKTVKQMFIFDVDGVIANPKEKIVTETRILDFIAKYLKSNNYVAFNTGRALDWIIERVLNPLIKKMKNNLLKNIFVVGEFGGAWLTFQGDGKIAQSIDKNISLPVKLQNQIRDLIKSKYSKSMRYDEDKKTMISTEMHDNYSLREYLIQQKLLLNDIKNLLKKNKLDKDLKVEFNMIAIDIMNKSVGKHFAMRKVFEWMKQNNFKSDNFIALGDNLSDIAIAEELYANKLPVRFVFVGEKEKFAGKTYHFPVIFTKEKYDKGTLEFLKTL